MIRCTRNILNIISPYHGSLYNLTYNFNNGIKSGKLITSQCQQRRYEHDRKLLSQTHLLFQDGTDLQELPLIVRIASPDLDLIDLADKKQQSKDESDRYRKSIATKDNFVDVAEIFSKCYTFKRLFNLVSIIPDEELTPSVAILGLNKVVQLESDNHFRNKFDMEFRSLLYIDENEEDEEFDDDHFAKVAIFGILTDKIVRHGSPQEVLEGLRVAKRIAGHGLGSCKQKICDEVLIQILDGKFNIQQICQSAKELLACGCKGGQDKVWIGLMEKEKEINSRNIMEVFRILPILKVSRNLVLKILQRRLEDQWFKMQGRDIAEILSILKEIKKPPHRIVKCLAKNIKTNLHALNEKDLLRIIKGFTDLNTSEADIERALEKYMKFRKSRIQNPDLMAMIMDYCKKFRIRSQIIFDGCCDFFVNNASSLSPVHLTSVVLPFGYLNIQPKKSSNFWQVLENVLNEKFVQLCPEDALDVMLSWVYLEKYPLAFVKKIFHPYFLDRLHSLKDPNLVQLMRNKLKLLDTALTLECDSYSGPLLPPDLCTHGVKQDGRIERISNCIKKALISLFGSPECVASSIVLKNLPLTELYIVDFIAHPSGTPTFLDYRDTPNACTAFLVHLPEHYDSSGQFLIGPQVMRKRHLQCIGLKVVGLHYYTVITLKHHERHLEEYLKHQIYSAKDI